ncbi:hypothetical protein [Roseivirga sp.]|uniref:hypothetical protein n=1 Tax=Roseivirga sp. TaxID=1964215 RepID=UPI003B52EDE3
MVQVLAMELHRQLSDQALIDQLNSAQLSPSYFSHEAHLRLAWLLIKQKGIHQAIEEVQQILKHYVKALGAEEKYNTTLTIAATKAVYAFMLESEAESFEEFMQDAPRLKTEFRQLMASHYSEHIFQAEEAKVKFMEPDLLPFP